MKQGLFPLSFTFVSMVRGAGGWKKTRVPSLFYQVQAPCTKNHITTTQNTPYKHHTPFTFFSSSITLSLLIYYPSPLNTQPIPMGNTPHNKHHLTLITTLFPYYPKHAFFNKSQHHSPPVLLIALIRINN